MQDIVPDLLDAIQRDYTQRINSSATVKRIQGMIEAGTATYAEANEYAIDVGNLLAAAFKDNLSSAVLPDGRMYYNIAQRILQPTMSGNYELVATAAQQVQTSLNHAAGLGLKGLKADLNQDRIDGLINRLASEESYDKVSWLLDDPVVTASQSIVDDTVRKNAEFQSEAGLRPKIIRKAEPKCCKWCSGLQGEYDYASVRNAGNDVFRRHANCRCTVEYEPGSGRVRNVHSGKWRDQDEQEKIEARKRVGIKDKREYVPAKTTEEAQEFAKEFCSGDVSYKGISVDNANAINRGMMEVYEKVDLDQVKGIKTISPTSSQGKKAFASGSDAVMSYSPVGKVILVNKEVLKNSETFAAYVQRSDDAWDTVMGNIDRLSGSQKNLALTYKNAGRSLVDGRTIEGMVTHELGHHVQWTLLDVKTNNSVGARMSQYAPKISGYANASKSEYLAESFSAYMKGEWDILDPEYVTFLRSRGK